MIRVIVISVLVLAIASMYSCAIAGKRMDAAMQKLLDKKIEPDNQDRRQ